MLQRIFDWYEKELGNTVFECAGCHFSVVPQDKLAAIWLFGFSHTRKGELIQTQWLRARKPLWGLTDPRRPEKNIDAGALVRASRENYLRISCVPLVSTAEGYQQSVSPSIALCKPLVIFLGRLASGGRGRGFHTRLG